MSCVEYNPTGIEEVTDQQASVPRLRPFIVPGRRELTREQVARYVTEFLDHELSRGSMPA